MIWLYILMPVFILGGIAIYFEKRSGAAPADERQRTEKLEEIPTRAWYEFSNPILKGMETMQPKFYPKRNV